MGRGQGVPNWKGEHAYTAISAVLPTGSVGWQKALEDYQKLADEDCDRLYSDFRTYFNSKMCNNGKKWTGRSSAPPTLERNQQLYARILDKMNSRDTLNDESSVDDDDYENEDYYDPQAEMEDVTNEEAGYGGNEENNSFDTDMSGEISEAQRPQRKRAADGDAKDSKLQKMQRKLAAAQGEKKPHPRSRCSSAQKAHVER